MNKTPRITFVLDTFGGGGKERRCLQIVQGLNKSGFKHIQFIIVNDTIAYPEIYQTSAQVIIINRKQAGLSYWQTYKLLKKHIHEFKSDIVQGWGFLSLFFLNFVRLTHNFIYIASHVADANKPRGLVSWINSSVNFLANAIIGNSLAGLKAYKVPLSKAYCIYNGYNWERLKDVKEFDGASYKEKLGINTPHVVTMVARVDDNKDYRCFVEIAKTICSKRSDITFLAVGKGNLLEKYRDYTADNQYIKFVGFRTDVEQILSVTTVSLLCTNIKKHQEGVSNTILESMALGVPVVATYGGGTPEIIENGVNGFCIMNNNIKDFIDKIETLIADKQKYLSFSNACKKTVMEKFSLDKSTEKYIELYKKMLRYK